MQLLSARVATFVLTSAEQSGDAMAAAFTTALPRILKLLARQPRPFVASVTSLGRVTVAVLPKGARLRTRSKYRR